MFTQVTVRYTDNEGITHEKQSMQMDATLFINYVYATAILQGWNVKSLMTISL